MHRHVSIATMVTRTRHNATLLAHCPSCVLFATFHYSIILKK